MGTFVKDVKNNSKLYTSAISAFTLNTIFSFLVEIYAMISYSIERTSVESMVYLIASILISLIALVISYVALIVHLNRAQLVNDLTEAAKEEEKGLI